MNPNYLNFKEKWRIILRNNSYILNQNSQEPTFDFLLYVILGEVLIALYSKVTLLTIIYNDIFVFNKRFFMIRIRYISST